MKKVALAAAIITMATMWLSSMVAYARPLQTVKPGQPGYIDWNHNQFKLGDSLFVIRCIREGEPGQFSTQFDGNGYLLPAYFPPSKNGVIIQYKFLSRKALSLPPLNLLEVLHDGCRLTPKRGDWRLQPSWDFAVMSVRLKDGSIVHPFHGSQRQSAVIY